MYIPEHFRESNPDRIGALIEEYAFGTLVTFDGTRPFASHVPFLYESTQLLCHLARSNPQVDQMRAGEDVLAIFAGPHAYVSPSWYESPAPPTWNYAVAHIYGKPTAIEDERQLQSLVEKMARYFEAEERHPWKPDYDLSMLAGIVGFRIQITETQGKFKLSQNRPDVDRRSVIERLEARGSENSTATAKLMRERQVG